MKIGLNILLAAFFFSCTAQAEPLEFVDFPLAKVDYMYREQGGPVAQLVFDLWVCTVNFLGHDFSLADANVEVLKNEYHNKARPVFKKLNTFKRFIDELSLEWVQKRERRGLRELFKKMFSRTQSKQYIDKLTAEELYNVLKDLRLFLWDVSHNAPYAKLKCAEKLSPKDRAFFEECIKMDYAELL